MLCSRASPRGGSREQTFPLLSAAIKTAPGCPAGLERLLHGLFFSLWNCKSCSSLLPLNNLKVKNNQPTPAKPGECSCDGLSTGKERHFLRHLRPSALTDVQGVLLLLDLEPLGD